MENCLCSSQSSFAANAQVLSWSGCAVIQRYGNSALAAALTAQVFHEVIHTACDAHQGQTRSSDGVAFVSHPLAVAQVLAQYGWDADLVAAAVLHDVVEDSGVALSEIEARFGPNTAGLVAAVTKNASIADKMERRMEALNRIHRLLPSLGPRLAMLKLFDRAHNLYTSHGLSCAKLKLLAYDAEVFFVPLAKSLGLNGLAVWMAAKPWIREGLVFEDFMLQFSNEASPASVMDAWTVQFSSAGGAQTKRFHRTF